MTISVAVEFDITKQEEVIERYKLSEAQVKKQVKKIVQDQINRLDYKDRVKFVSDYGFEKID